jgi:hypothetical protein
MLRWFDGVVRTMAMVERTLTNTHIQTFLAGRELSCGLSSSSGVQAFSRSFSAITIQDI